MNSAVDAVLDCRAREGACMAVCHYHPDRIGVGVCMRCRVVICAACCTRVDGINHCHACLKAMGQAVERSTPHLAPVTALAILTLGLIGMLLLGVGCLTQGT